MQSLRDIFLVNLMPPYVHGIALIRSYPAGRGLFGHALQEVVPAYDRSPRRSFDL